MIKVIYFEDDKKTVCGCEYFEDEELEECTIVKGVDTFFKEKYLRTVA